MEKKRTIIQVVICVGMLVLVWGSYLVTSDFILKKRVSELKPEEDSCFLYDICDMKNDEKTLTMSGWVSRLGSNIDDIWISFESIDAKTKIVSNVEQMGKFNMSFWEEKQKINTEVFQAKVDVDKVLDDVCYEICVTLHYSTKNEKGQQIFDKHKVFTGKYLYNRQVYKYNPISYEKPMVNEEKIQNVIDNGELVFFDASKGVWIYFYEQTLYWVVNSLFQFERGGKTYLPCHVYDLKEVDMSNDTENEFVYFNFNDIYFEENEIIFDEEKSPYRVAMKKLSEEMITWIRVGKYDVENEDWFWRNMVPIMSWH